MTFLPLITSFYTIFPRISRQHFLIFFRDSFGFGKTNGPRMCRFWNFEIPKFRNLSKFGWEWSNIAGVGLFRNFSSYLTSTLFNIFPWFFRIWKDEWPKNMTFLEFWDSEISKPFEIWFGVGKYWRSWII